jgi:hypothetical protein
MLAVRLSPADHLPKDGLILQGGVMTPEDKNPKNPKNPETPQISNRKREANQINSQSSSGPKTEAGKKTSSRNAVKHGIFASEVVNTALGERRADFNALLRELRDVWEPVGRREERDVQEIAKTTWRKERVLRAENGELTKGMSVLWNKIRERKEQFNRDRLEWEIMRLQGKLTPNQSKKALVEQVRDIDGTIRKLRGTIDGVDFVSNIVKTVREEIEETETLSKKNLSLLLDCLGIEGIDLLGITESDEELEKEELEMVLAFLDHQISSLKAQEQFLQTALEHESSATLHSLSLPSPVASSNLLRYDAHLERKLCRDIENLDRRQTQRKKGS